LFDRRSVTGRGQTTQRIDVEDDEHDGQPDGERLREKGAAEEPQRRGVPTQPHRPRSVDLLEPREKGEHEEEPGHHVAALGDPGHRLDAQRMHGKQERRRGCSQRDIAGGRARGEGPGEEAAGHGIEAERGGRVEEEAREVIAGGIHAPHEIVGAQGEPGQGNVVTHVEGREHPLELGEPQAAIGRVVEKIDGIVPVDEAVLEHTEERGAGERYDEEAQRRPQGREGRPGCPEPDLARSGRADGNQVDEDALGHGGVRDQDQLARNEAGRGDLNRISPLAEDGQPLVGDLESRAEPGSGQANLGIQGRASMVIRASMRSERLSIPPQ